MKVWPIFTSRRGRNGPNKDDLYVMEHRLPEFVANIHLYEFLHLQFQTQGLNLVGLGLDVSDDVFHALNSS